MSILGVILRSRVGDVAAVSRRLAQMPGVDIAINPGDGRLILVIEDTPGRPAATSLAEFALWPLVLNTSLVYEYSGPDLPDQEAGVTGYAAWRESLTTLGVGRAPAT